MCSTPDAPQATPPSAPVVPPSAMALPDNTSPLGLAALRIGGQGLAAADAAKKLTLGPKTPTLTPLTRPGMGQFGGPVDPNSPFAPRRLTIGPGGGSGSSDGAGGDTASGAGTGG